MEARGNEEGTLLAPAAVPSNKPGGIPGGELPRVKALDGVRGLAVLLVMIHHFTFIPKDGPFPDKLVYALGKLGWTGVDLFFVLSGYLITGILIENRGRDRYYSTFYARRILRILPLYYAVLALTLFLLPKVVDLGSIRGSSLWFWFHVSNIQMAFNGFSHKSLNVCWSLAIEEQFYLFWPIVVSVSPPRQLGRISILVFAGSALIRLAMNLWGVPWVATYVLTPCRLDGLALGALLATRPSAGIAQGTRARRLALTSGLLVAIVLLLTRSSHMDRWIGTAVGYAALAVFWVAVVAMALSVSTAASFFSASPLTFLGRYSYALYLLHVPAALFLRDSVFGLSRWPRFMGSLVFGQVLFHLLALSMSCALAWGSWQVLEGPVLRLKKYFRYG